MEQKGELVSFRPDIKVVAITTCFKCVTAIGRVVEA